jgi:hypothetical protein
MASTSAAAAADIDDAKRLTVRLVVSVALEQRVPDLTVFHAGQPAGAGYLYSSRHEISDEQLEKLREAIHGLIADDVLVETVSVSAEEFARLVPESFELSKAGALRHMGDAAIKTFRLGSAVRRAYGPALPSTGRLSAAETFVTRPSNGDKRSFIVAYVSQEKYEEQTGIVDSIQDIIRWADHLAVNSISALNALTPRGADQRDFALHSEFRQDMKIADVANRVRGTSSSSSQPCFFHRRL